MDVGVVGFHFCYFITLRLDFLAIRVVLLQRAAQSATRGFSAFPLAVAAQRQEQSHFAHAGASRVLAGTQLRRKITRPQCRAQAVAHGPCSPAPAATLHEPKQARRQRAGRSTCERNRKSDKCKADAAWQPAGCLNALSERGGGSRVPMCLTASPRQPLSSLGALRQPWTFEQPVRVNLRREGEEEMRGPSEHDIDHRMLYAQATATVSIRLLKKVRSTRSARD